jgi:hypothetical protein
MRNDTYFMEKVVTVDVNQKQGAIKKWLNKKGGPSTVIAHLFQNFFLAAIVASMLFLIVMSVIDYLLYR